MGRRSGERTIGYQEKRAVLSSDETVKFWIEKNHCLKKAEISTPLNDPSTQTSVSQETYSCDTGQVRYVRYHVQGGGHTWPGGLQYMNERWIGKTTRAFNASQRIVEFFDL